MTIVTIKTSPHLLPLNAFITYNALTESPVPYYHIVLIVN